MQIAIDARSLNTLPNEEEKQHLLNTLQQLLVLWPSFRFIIIAQKAILQDYNNAEHLPAPEVKGVFKIRNWYQKQLPKLLKQKSVEQLIVINGCPAAMQLPQLVLVSSANALRQAYNSQPFTLLAKKFFIKKLRQAPAIATFTTAQQANLVSSFGLNDKKIQPVGYTLPTTYQPANWQQREHFVETQTNGKEYFLVPYITLGQNLMLLLKAFSLFKKRQQSSMQLVIAGQFSDTEFSSEKLETYKYRADVMMLPNADAVKMTNLTASAYTIIIGSEKMDTAFVAAAAIQCGVPVIGFESNEALHEAAGTAALYAAPTQESLAEQMKEIYKNENLRQALVAQALHQAAYNKENNGATKLMQYLEMAAAQNQPTFGAQ